MKTVLGYLATILVFVGYIPYLRDIIRGKTKPHLYSWFLWSFITVIIFSLQISGGAGTGSLITLAASSMCLAVIILGITYKNTVKITKIDTFFLFLSLIALGLWLVAKQPVLSTVLIVTVDLLGFAPTIRKSWQEPYTETLSFYCLNSVRFALAIMALQKYTIVTALSPVSWLLANTSFVLMLNIRRKQISNK